MKSLYFTLSLTFYVGVLFAQTSVPRVPLYEVFSSSTCGPCRPANEHLTPIFEQYEGQVAVVKYQMSWPGFGDPYYTVEGNSRRGNYGVNSVPAFFRNAQGQGSTSFQEADVDDDLLEEAQMVMYLRYMINTESQSISLRARVEALTDFTAGAHRWMIPITEKVTYNNAKSNGETEFHNVFKKMMPSANGEIIIGKLDSGDVFELDTTYAFQGSYRLPNNSDDPINDAIEHSVEDFNNLHVVMFMQSMAADKSIYQAAVGERSATEEDFLREWGTDPTPALSLSEFNAGKAVVLYPNPVNDMVTVKTGDDMISSIEVLDITGKRIAVQENLGGSQAQWSLAEVPNGVYLVKVVTDSGQYMQRLLVEH